MVNISKVSKNEAQKIADANPARKQGQWKQLAEKIVKDGQPRTVTGLTRGQAWGVKRTMENNNLTCRVINKGTGVLISKPAKE